MKSYQTNFKSFRQKIAQMGALQKLQNSIQRLITLWPVYSPRSSSLGAYNYYPILLSRRFHRPIYFYFEFISNSDPHGNLSNQLQSQARNNVDVSTCSREAALFYRHRSVRARVDWNWPISRERYVKIDWSVKMPLHWLIMGVAGS